MEVSTYFTVAIKEKPREIEKSVKPSQITREASLYINNKNHTFNPKRVYIFTLYESTMVR